MPSRRASLRGSRGNFVGEGLAVGDGLAVGPSGEALVSGCPPEVHEAATRSVAVAVAARIARIPDTGTCQAGGNARLVGLPQHPDQHRPEDYLLAVDQQLGEGAALRVAPELSDPVGAVEVREHEDVEQLVAGSGAKVV